jgi:DUF1707 SHOCT-like domain
MAMGPGDELDAAGRGHLRASHADREQVIGILKAAFVQGRLAKDELDLRVGQALASRTYVELAALTADLPAGLAGALPPRRAAPARRPMSNAAKAGIWVVIAVAVPVILSFPTGSPAFFLLFTPFYFMALAFLGAEILASQLKKRSQRGQLPPGPAPGLGGPASPQPPSAGPGRQVPPGHRGHGHTAEAARRRLPRPLLPVRGHSAGGAPRPGRLRPAGDCGPEPIPTALM